MLTTTAVAIIAIIDWFYTAWRIAQSLDQRTFLKVYPKHFYSHQLVFNLVKTDTFIFLVKLSFIVWSFKQIFISLIMVLSLFSFGVCLVIKQQLREIFRVSLILVNKI